jgi:hypothetical protein
MNFVLKRDIPINRFEWHRDTRNFFLRKWPPFCPQHDEGKYDDFLGKYSSKETATIVFPATCDSVTLNYLVAYGFLGNFQWNDGVDHNTNILELISCKGTSWLDPDSAKKFRFFWDNKWGSVPSLRSLIEFPQVYQTFFETPVRNNDLSYVFFEFNGPDENFVEAYEGEDPIEGKIYPFGNVLFYPCLKKKSSDKKDVPIAIKKMVLLDKAQDSFRPSVLLSSSYYKKSLDSFTSWSFEGHRAQVLSIISMFPEHILVAPADGSGIVASFSRTGSICGDSTVTDLTHPLVRKEDISQTIDRGFLAKSPVFILSYCWSFLKEYDRNRLISSGHPVVVIDSGKREIQFPCSSYSTHPGLYFLNVERIPASIVQFPKEKVSEEENIEYTENLLNTFASCSNMIVFAQNKYYRYLVSMMPKRESNLLVSVGSSYFPISAENSIVLCSSLAEVSFCLNFDAQVYWAPGGHIIPPISLDADFSMDTKFSSRMIYSSPSTVFLQSLLSSYNSVGVFIYSSFVSSGGIRTLFTVRKGTHRVSGISKLGFFSFVVRSEEELIEHPPVLSLTQPSFPDRTIILKEEKELQYYITTNKNGGKRWSIDYLDNRILLSTFSGDGLGPKSFKELVLSSKCFSSTIFLLLLFPGCYYPLRQISLKTDGNLLPNLYFSGFKEIIFDAKEDKNNERSGKPNRSVTSLGKKKK